MAPEGKDNVKGQACLGCKRNSLLPLTLLSHGPSCRPKTNTRVTTNHVIIPFTNLGSEAALRLDVPTRRAVIADEARTYALDVDQTADATGPRILVDLTGSAPLVARQNASGK